MTGERFAGRPAIVHASKTFPYEENDLPAIYPTVLGVRAKNIVYKFVDGGLYEIDIALDHDKFDRLIASMRIIFGDPVAKKTAIYRNFLGEKFEGDTLVWKNNVSQINAFERAGATNLSMIVLSDNASASLAAGRINSTINGHYP